VLNYSIFRDRMKAVTDCVGRFSPDSRDSFVNLYTKIDASAIASKPEVPAESVSTEAALNA
jgi:hypothetical protein